MFSISGEAKGDGTHTAVLHIHEMAAQMAFAHLIAVQILLF